MKQIQRPLNIKVDLATLAEKLHGYCYENKIMMVNYSSPVENFSIEDWQQDLTIRLDIVCCILVTQGTLSISLNYKHIEIERNTLVFISPFDIVENPRLSDQGRYFVLMFKRSFTEEAASNIFFQVNPAQLTPKTEPVSFVKLSDTEMVAFQNRFQSLYYYLEEERGDLKKYFIISAFYTLGLEFVYLISSRNSEGKPLQSTQGEGRKNTLMRNFMILLNEHCTTEHNPAFYAHKLFISVQYLSLILKEKTGQTAGDWIANILILRAKALLRAPNANIAAIAEELHFADQSSFGKFFKKHTGTTPKGYINSQH